MFSLESEFNNASGELQDLQMAGPVIDVASRSRGSLLMPAELGIGGFSGLANIPAHGVNNVVSFP